MAPQPYTFKRQVTLSSLGTGNISIVQSVGLKFHGKRWIWNSQGIFNLVDLAINNSTHLIDASIANPIKSAALQQQASPNFNWDRFESELLIDSNQTLTLSFVDTSAGSNLVELTLIGIMDFP